MGTAKYFSVSIIFRHKAATMHLVNYRMFILDHFGRSYLFEKYFRFIILLNIVIYKFLLFIIDQVYL